MLARRYRLTTTSEFLACLRKGEATGNEIVTVHLLPKTDGPRRAGVAVSRRIGGPVTRNRVKRLLREAIRSVITEDSAPFDVVLVARSGAAQASSGEIAGAVLRLVGAARKKAGI
jgi:ribonuclease P protein component